MEALIGTKSKGMYFGRRRICKDLLPLMLLVENIICRRL